MLSNSSQQVIKKAQEQRASFQRKLTPLFKTVPVGSAVMHLRRRMDRWNMETLKGHRHWRAVNVLKVLKTQSTPRVQAAFLRIICNGWCTAHRFQSQHNCLFGCGVGADKVEHFATCSVVMRLYANGVGINLLGGSNAGSLDSFLCMLDTLNAELLVKRALGLYALHRLHCGIRHNAFVQEEYDTAFASFVRFGRSA